MKPFFVCITTDNHFMGYGIRKGERLLFNINLKTRVADIITESDTIVTGIKPIDILRHTSLVMNNGLLHYNRKLSARANNLLAGTGVADGGDRKSSRTGKSIKTNQ